MSTKPLTIAIECANSDPFSEDSVQRSVPRKKAGKFQSTKKKKKNGETNPVFIVRKQ
jgi:hypothetical protein